MRQILLALAFVGTASLADALECESIEHADNGFTICSVDPTRESLRLYLADEEGAPFGHFSDLDNSLTQRGEKLRFAMNAGMYHEDRAPVGHYVEDGQERMRVIPNAGPGNFGLLPNGVFCIGNGWARVYETLSFLDLKPACRYATQSGPMLVIDGALHPDFLPDGTSRYIRNGVGTSADGTQAVFAISDNPVTFHQFATLFRDVLKLPFALFLDGNVSRLYAPDLGRRDLGRRMGPIVAVTSPAGNN